MRKILIGAVIVCAASFVQAAAVDWTASGVCDPVATAAAGKNTPANGWLGYMILAADYSTVTADLAAGKSDSLVAKAVGPAKTTTSKGAFTAGTATGAVASGNQDFYLIVLNSSSASSFTGFYVTDKVTKEIDASLDTTVAFGKLQDGTASASGWTAAAPEPTSGILLLLGIAGLALKRKRA